MLTDYAPEGAAAAAAAREQPYVPQSRVASRGSATTRRRRRSGRGCACCAPAATWATTTTPTTTRRDDNWLGPPRPRIDQHGDAKDELGIIRSQLSREARRATLDETPPGAPRGRARPPAACSARVARAVMARADRHARQRARLTFRDRDFLRRGTAARPASHSSVRVAHPTSRAGRPANRVNLRGEFVEWLTQTDEGKRAFKALDVDRSGDADVFELEAIVHAFDFARRAQRRARARGARGGARARCREGAARRRHGAFATRQRAPRASRGR